MSKLNANNKILVGVLIIAIDLILLISFAAIHFVAKNRTELLYSQQAAKRWESGDKKCTQISIFYSEDAGLKFSDIKNIRNAIQKKLYADSLITDSKSDDSLVGARSWIDAYSGHTFDDVRKDSNKVHVNVYTVGGDFFQIHNMPLKSGSYLDMKSTDVNQILVDEYVAWNLFGGDNIAGMKVWIGDDVYTVTGVVKCDDTQAAKEAYGEYSSVYVPMEAYSKASKKLSSGEDTSGDLSGNDTLSAESEGTVVTCYEAVLPNPIKNYGLNTVAEAAEIHFLTDEEKAALKSSLDFSDREILENTTRFSRVCLYNRLKAKKYEVMKTNSLVYPYWENEARFEESYQIRVFLFDIVALVIFIISFIGIGVIIYKSLKDKLHGVIKRDF